MRQIADGAVRGKIALPLTVPPCYGARMEKLEEQIAHLMRTVEELNEVVTQQQTEITTLNRRVHMLMQREGEREAATGGAVVMGDERPPHY